ncbi:asparagine synthase (glutamine-hydrolyzing) [Microbulbifer sp. ZKSA004]|uniref:asparagine synthase (glutamine-hydrolyzing) n=1 Tax=Microbulbifer sp. ZKSA004 TaxID=3243389 RepID=UPI00403A1806
MCGITGIINIDGQPISDGQITTFNNSLTHRGPDSGCIWVDNSAPIGLGHRRLAIVDLSDKGKQPMHYNNRYHLTYNGEIYNHIELRQELESLGHHFISDSDAEVLLIAYAQWGDECLNKLNGMWAFAIWDSIEEELTICVDRFAIKSCVYVSNEFYFAFASEVKAFLHLDRFNLVMNEDEIYRRLYSKEHDTIETIVKDVFRIPAGHFLKVSKKQRPRLVRWWNTLEHTANLAEYHGCRKEMLRDLLESSVQLRMRSDKPFGIPISGGMDSSSVLMMADKVLSKGDISYSHIDIFHIVKNGPRSELPAVEILNSKTHSKLHKIEEFSRMSYTMMRKLLFNNENIGVTSEGPYRVYQRMRENNIVVSLDGHGADELMAGYHFYTPAAMLDALSGIPDPFRAADISQVWYQMAKNSSAISTLQQLKSRVKFLKQFVGSQKRKKQQINIPDYIVSRQIRPRFSLLDQDKHLLGGLDDNLNCKLYEEFHFGFLQKILRAFDYASMANGVEARTPFLDWRIVCFLFSLPSKTKMGKGLNKLLLRQSMKGILPPEVNGNPVKTGFITSNSNYFLNSEILEWIGDSLHSCSGILPNLVNITKVRENFNLYKRKRLSYAEGLQLYQIAQIVELENMYHEIHQNNNWAVA